MARSKLASFFCGTASMVGGALIGMGIAKEAYYQAEKNGHVPGKMKEEGAVALGGFLGGAVGVLSYRHVRDANEVTIEFVEGPGEGALQEAYDEGVLDGAAMAEFASTPSDIPDKFRDALKVSSF